MEEKPVVIQKEQKEPVRAGRVYAPPELTVYGKLADLTAGGTKSNGEGTPGSLPTDKP